LLTRGVTDSLIDGEDRAGGLGGSGQNVVSDNLGLPDKQFIHVGDLSADDVNSLPDAFAVGLVVHLSQFVEHVGGVHTSVVGELAGDSFEGLGEAVKNELLLALNISQVLSEVSGELHLDGTTSGNDGVSSDSSSHNHNSVVERSLGLFDVLGSTTTNDKSDSSGTLALGEHIISLRAELNFFEFASETEDLIGKAVGGGLDSTAASLGNTVQIVGRHSSSAEHVSVREVLSGQVTNGELGEHNLGTGVNDFLEFIVDDLPFSVDNLLELFGVRESDLSGVLLGLKLKLDVEDEDLGIHEGLGLLLETSVGERLLEADTLDEERVSHGSSGDLLDTNVLLVEVSIEVHDGVDDHLGEETLVLGDNLGVEGSRGALFEQVTLLLGALVADLHGDLLETQEAETESLTVALDNDLGVHALVNEVLGLLEELTGGKHDRSGTVTDFVVLRLGDVDEGLGSGVHDVEELDESCSIVGDGHTSSVVDKLVHAAGTESGLDDVDDGGAGIDVGKDLTLAGRLISSVLENDNLRRLSKGKHC